MASARFPILFITHSRLGDAVLSSGLIPALAERHPGARFTIVASALTAPLFAQTPGLEDLIVLEKQRLGLHWLRLFWRLGLRRWGLIVDLRGAPITAVFNHRRRLAHRKTAAPVHKVREAGRLLGAMQAPPAPFLATNDEIESRAKALTKGRGPILAIAPCANWVGKAWPAERYARVARELLGRGGALAGGRLMVLGGPEDRREAGPVLSAAPKARVIDLVGREDLLVLYAALKRVRLFIGGDTGLTHMAAAAGAPCLALFGPSDESLYAPWGAKTQVIRGARGFAEFKRIDPKLNLAIRHIIELKPEAALTAAHTLLEMTAPPGRSAATSSPSSSQQGSVHAPDL
jgi:ADP-heptose:LPS heptosyltransferase